LENEQTLDNRKASKSGDLFLIASVIAWGVNFPFAKFVLAFSEPIVSHRGAILVTAWSMLFGATILTIVGYLHLDCKAGVVFR